MAVLHMPGAKTRLHLPGALTQDQTHINVGKCLGCLSDRPLTATQTQCVMHQLHICAHSHKFTHITTWTWLVEKLHETKSVVLPLTQIL